MTAVHDGEPFVDLSERDNRPAEKDARPDPGRVSPGRLRDLDGPTRHFATLLKLEFEEVQTGQPDVDVRQVLACAFGLEDGAGPLVLRAGVPRSRPLPVAAAEDHAVAGGLPLLGFRLQQGDALFQVVLGPGRLAGLVVGIAKPAQELSPGQVIVNMRE